MLIEHVLQRKGRDVATTTPDTSIAQVAAELRERQIGALVVSSPEQEVAGIISERDVVVALADQGPAALELPVRDLMSTEVTTCTLRNTVDELMRLMTDRRIRHIPVVEKGRLAGIVSIGDVVKTRIDELETETETLHGYLSTGRS